MTFSLHVLVFTKAINDSLRSIIRFIPWTVLLADSCGTVECSGSLPPILGSLESLHRKALESHLSPSVVRLTPPPLLHTDCRLAGLCLSSLEQTTVQVGSGVVIGQWRPCLTLIRQRLCHFVPTAPADCLSSLGIGPHASVSSVIGWCEAEEGPVRETCVSCRQRGRSCREIPECRMKSPPAGHLLPLPLRREQHLN